MDAITVTEDIFAPRMLGELSVGASAVVASSKIAMTSASASIGGSPEFKGDNDEEKLDNNMTNMMLSSHGNTQSMGSLHGHKFDDGYDSSESVSSVASNDRTPLARKRRLKPGVLGSLDDVIEEMPVFSLANTDNGLFGNMKEIDEKLIGYQHCTSGELDVFREPLVKKGKRKGGGWVPTGLFPQEYWVELGVRVRSRGGGVGGGGGGGAEVKKLVVVGSGIRKMWVEGEMVGGGGGGEGRVFYSTRGGRGEGGVEVEEGIGTELVVHQFLLDGDGDGKKGIATWQHLKVVIGGGTEGGAGFIVVQEIKLLIEN